MAVKGVFASDQNIPGGQMGDFASGLLQIMPTGSAQLLALSSGMQSADAHDTVVNWFEENHMTGRISVNGAIGDGTTTAIVVDDASEVVGGAIFLVESTGEYIYVESVAGVTLTVKRGLGDASLAAAIGDGAFMQKVGTAQEEGSDKPISIANLGYPRFNYLQNFRNTWDVTGTARAVNYSTGDLAAKNKGDAANLHAEDIERACIFSIRAIGIQNSKPFRTMNGVVNQLTTNVTSQSTNTTWDDIDAFLQSIFEKNIKGKPNERIVFCGNTVVSTLNSIARLEGQFNMEAKQTDFGMKIINWYTPYGDVSLMTHPLFNENATWTKNLLIMHPAAVRMRYLRRTHEDSYDKDGTRAGADADFGVFTTEMCIEYKAEKTGGYYTGIDTAAAVA